MQMNHKPRFVFDPHWYKNIEYIKDQERGIPYSEDLYVPGYFEVEIKKGEPLIFSAGVEEVNTRTLTKMYDNTYLLRREKTLFICSKRTPIDLYG